MDIVLMSPIFLTCLDIFLNAILKCIHTGIYYFITKYLTYLIKNINPYLKNNYILIQNKITVIPLQVYPLF